MNESRPFQVDKGPRATDIKLESSRLEACLEHYRANALDEVAISPLTGFTASDLEFLRDHPYLRRVNLFLCGAIDLSGLRHLRDLEYLRVDGNFVTLELAQFERLRALDVVWHRKLPLTSDCTALRDLVLRKYKSHSRNLAGVPALPGLQELSLIQGNVASLEGVERFSGLRKLVLAYLRQLTSLVPLAAVHESVLDELECERCPRLAGHAVLSRLPSLRVLRLFGAGDIVSLDFVRAAPALEELRFVDCNVVDGDLSPCLNLERVGFMNKRHYSHTMRQVAEHIGDEAALRRLDLSSRRRRS